MKLPTTLAALAALAITSWAAMPPAPPVAFPPLFYQGEGGSCPTPAPASKKTWKHGRAEYNDFTAATSATSNAQKARLAAAFAQKYPDSNYRNEALQLEMSAQAASPATQPAAVKTAHQLMQSSNATAPQLLAADVIAAYLGPNLVKPDDPNLASQSQSLLNAASCGQQLLSSMPSAYQSRYSPILLKAKGFAQLNLKQYGAAITTLQQAAQANPKDPLPYYWMGIAAVTQATPNYNVGIFDLAKASVLSPQTGAIASYLTTVYTGYHGSTDGLQTVLTTARNNAAPPQGFNILTKNQVQYNQALAKYNAEKLKLANELPPADSFKGIVVRLKKPDLAAGEWRQVKGQGYELTGIVTAVSAKAVDVAVGATDPTTAKANLRVNLFTPFKPKAKRPHIGQTVTVKGVADAFRPNPPNPNENFELIMKDGVVEGFGPPTSKG
ncbi:MAG: hypothetical protein ACRD04_09635 [Terriglobales bacterium]